MSSEGSSSALDGSVDGNMAHNALFNIESLSLSIGVSVLQELMHVANRLLGPSSLGDTVDLGLSSSADVAGVSSEGHALLVFKHVFHVLNGLLDSHSLDDSGGLVGVLKVNSQIVRSALGGYKR